MAHRFKVGDKVRCLNTFFDGGYYANIIPGEKYIVMDVDSVGNIRLDKVYIDMHIYRHECFELVVDILECPFKVGDKVCHINDKLNRYHYTVKSIYNGFFVLHECDNGSYNHPNDFKFAIPPFKPGDKVCVDGLDGIYEIKDYDYYDNSDICWVKLITDAKPVNKKDVRKKV